MPTPDLIALFIGPLEQLGAPYMITGATAAILYGQPRLTNDIDVVIELRRDEIQQLRAGFPEADFYVPPADIIEIELSRPQRAHFNLIHFDTGYKADLYVVGSDPLHLWAMPRRHRIPYGTGHLQLAPPEYVILRKLEYFREGGSSKHRTDIQAILRVSVAEVDHVALTEWIERLGLTTIWDNVRPT
jgi:hypothetical protein